VPLVQQQDGAPSAVGEGGGVTGEVPDHVSWDELRRELGFDVWQAAHPWQYRKIRFRMWARKWIWRCTRIDIG
jgi:hypothetical protein